ncbi:hypothetical protein L2E82_04554 [Cichorium intybus]|uniref:Uncharacterized protein n=1 Tax=Cichorium intybus TaxID=13427 RepID=A0ACB9H6Y8_CICIN|nr:hypothetical protein L2E82_04554 [Cichorium intybus]
MILVVTLNLILFTLLLTHTNTRFFHLRLRLPLPSYRSTSRYLPSVTPSDHLHTDTAIGPHHPILSVSHALFYISYSLSSSSPSWRSYAEQQQQQTVFRR